MAISKITYKSSPSATPETWMDATGATAAAADIVSPKTAMLADGVVTTGTGTSPTGTKQISITANGTTTEDVAAYANAEITVDVQGGGGFSISDFASGAIPTGEIDITGLTFVENAFSGRQYITKVIGSGNFNAGAIFSRCAGIETVHVSLTETVSNNHFASCTGLKTAVLSLSVNGGVGIFNGCAGLEIADLDVVRLRTNCFYNNTKLATIILRKSDAITAMENTAVFGTAEHFKSGGSGGTIYIPETLYNHLGDGTALDYKAATNWSTVDGYGTITWAQIEGSIYETQYADGTPIT